MFVGDLVKLSSYYERRMFLNTKTNKKVITWNSSDLGIIISIEGEYLSILLPTGVGLCCVDEVQIC